MFNEIEASQEITKLPQGHPICRCSADFSSKIDGTIIQNIIIKNNHKEKKMENKNYEEILKLEESEVFGDKVFRIKYQKEKLVIEKPVIKLFENSQDLYIGVKNKNKNVICEYNEFYKLGSVWDTKYLTEELKEAVETYNKKHGKIPTFEEEYAKCEEVKFSAIEGNYRIDVDNKGNICAFTTYDRTIGVKYISKKDCERLVEMSKKYKWKV